MDRHKLPIVDTRGQHTTFHSNGARAVCISLMVGGMADDDMHFVGAFLYAATVFIGAAT